jgi:hypothetical protein
MPRKAYFHDVLKALTDANLQDQFAVYVEKKDLPGGDYHALYVMAYERGMEVFLEQIRSGEFARELRDL